LKTVSLDGGEPHPLQVSYIESLQRVIFKTEHEFDALEPINGAQLAAAVEEQEFRLRVLQGSIFISLIDEEVTEGEIALVREFARAMGVSDSAITDMRLIFKGHAEIAKFDVMRRYIAKDQVLMAMKRGGLAGTFEVIQRLRKKPRAEVAARYRALEQLPLGTLGREYWEFNQRNKYPLPGEEGGPREIILIHDCLHVLGGYGTDAFEEAQVISFTAGCRSYDPFGVMLSAVFQFHLGVNVAPGVPVARGSILDMAKIFEALQRGAQTADGLVESWDPRDDFDTPLSDLRARFNVLPRT
jgi:hypothetical protein